MGCVSKRSDPPIYLELRPEDDKGDGPLGPSSPAVANADAEAKRFGASVLTTHRLSHWVPLLRDVGAIDMQNFFLDFRLLHPRVPLKDLSERVYDEGLRNPSPLRRKGSAIGQSSSSSR